VDDELLRALARTQKRHIGPDTPMDTTADRVAPTDSLPAELIRPLDADERAGILDAVFARVDEDAGRSKPVSITAARSSSRGRVAAIAGGVLAIAAALVLWIALPRGVDPQLPYYALTELRGGASTMRSDPSALDRVLELRAGEPISLTITPERATSEPLVVDVIAEAEGRPASMARVPAQVSSNGAVRIRGALDEWLTLAPGDWDITVVVAPADRAPADAQAALADEGSRRVTFRVAIAPG
jgi:hypothetical protein